MTATFQTVSMSLIAEPPSPLRANIDGEKLAELARDIATNGLLNPITLRATEAGFVIIAGHRRFLAVRSLGWDTIPAMAFPPGTGDDAILSLAENLHRENLTPIEEARVVYDMVVERDMDVDLAAARFSKSRAWIDGRLELLDYPADLLAALHDGKIALGTARELARVADQGYREYLLNNAVENGCTAKTARLWVDEWERSAGIQGQPTTGYGGPSPPYQGQTVGVACGGCDVLMPIENLRPLLCCPDCIKEHYAMKAKARAAAASGIEPGRGN